jgi:hypothetical protein
MQVTPMPALWTRAGGGNYTYKSWQNYKEVKKKREDKEK